MQPIILYATKYGSTKAYAEAFAARIQAPCRAVESVKSLPADSRVFYFGGIYAGKMLGLNAALKALQPTDWVAVAVGIADPHIPENMARTVRELRRQIGDYPYPPYAVYALHGKLDYQKLSPLHRIMMAMMRRMLRRKGDRQTAEDRRLVETYPDTLDFISFSDLDPLEQSL